MQITEFYLELMYNKVKITNILAKNRTEVFIMKERYLSKFFEVSEREFSDEGIMEEARAEDARHLGDLIADYANENNLRIEFVGQIRHDKFGKTGVVVIFEHRV